MSPSQARNLYKFLGRRTSYLTKLNFDTRATLLIYLPVSPTFLFRASNMFPQFSSVHDLMLPEVIIDYSINSLTFHSFIPIQTHSSSLPNSFNHSFFFLYSFILSMDSTIQTNHYSLLSLCFCSWLIY